MIESALYAFTEKDTGLFGTYVSLVLSVPTTVAVTMFLPSTDPVVHFAAAIPFCPTVTSAGAAGETLPPPSVTANATRAPTAGEPSVRRTATRIESGRSAPGEM